MRWPWSRKKDAVQATNTDLSIADPAVAGYFSIGGANYSGSNVGEGSALALSAVWRAVSLISSTLASLPLRTITDKDGQRQRTSSVFDDPGGVDGQTPFGWKETLYMHMLLHGNAFALKVRNGAGNIVALPLVHPLSVAVIEPTYDEYRTGKLPQGGLWFYVTLNDGSRRKYDAYDVLHFPAQSMNGKTGLSVLAIARNSLGTTISADRAAAKQFSNGALIAGMVSPDEDMDPEEAIKIREELDSNVAGWENAGAIAVLNKRLNFTPWTMTAADAQFLQSRQFQIEEIARWFGVPPFELMQTDKQTSWGTGIEAQQRGLGRTVLSPWANRVEAVGSRILPAPRFIEFDFSGLERPTPAEEIDLLLKQTGGKPILTQDEARKIRNMPPLTAAQKAEMEGVNNGNSNAE